MQHQPFTTIILVVKFQKFYICKLLKLNSEDPQLIPPLVLDIFIDGEEKHVGEEDAKATEEVPDVVEVVEVEEVAGLVEVPRLRGGQIGVLLGLQKCIAKQRPCWDIKFYTCKKK